MISTLPPLKLAKNFIFSFIKLRRLTWSVSLKFQTHTYTHQFFCLFVFVTKYTTFPVILGKVLVCPLVDLTPPSPCLNHLWNSVEYLMCVEHLSDTTLSYLICATNIWKFRLSKKKDDKISLPKTKEDIDACFCRGNTLCTPITYIQLE